MFSSFDLLMAALAGIVGGWLVAARQRRRTTRPEGEGRGASPETFRVRAAAPVEAGQLVALDSDGCARPAATAPAMLSDADQVRHAEALRRAQTAIEALQRSLYTYKALADRFERGLSEAREETAQERLRTDAYRRHAEVLEGMLRECQAVAGRYQAAYAARTVQMLGAGMNLVIDHGDRRRPNVTGEEGSK